MNDFNFMIGFDYNSNGLLHHLTEEEQVAFYNRMHQEFPLKVLSCIVVNAHGMR